MKRVEKVALGCAALLVSACVLSILLLTFTDLGTGVLRSTSQVASRGRLLKALDEKYPFTAPPDARVGEARLRVYLDASCGSKAAADAVEPWLEKHQQVVVMGEPVYSGQGAALMMAYLESLRDSLDAARMGPREFDWIFQRMTAAAAGPPSAKRQEEIRRMVQELRARAEDPRLSPESRAGLKREIGKLEVLPDLWGAAMQADYALAQKYADRLSACSHGRRAVHAMGDLVYSGPGETRIEIHPPEAPDPPDTPRSAQPPAN